MLAVNVGGYSFEAGNVGRRTADKFILPGVVSHATNVVERPEVIADRIVRCAEGVGGENVVASTECGLGGRIHPQIAGAKLDALMHGAELATQRL